MDHAAMARILWNIETVARATKACPGGSTRSAAQRVEGEGGPECGEGVVGEGVGKEKKVTCFLM